MNKTSILLSTAMCLFVVSAAQAAGEKVDQHSSEQKSIIDDQYSDQSQMNQGVVGQTDEMAEGQEWTETDQMAEASTAQEAIDNAEMLASDQQKEDYLTRQARAFLDREEFQESQQVAEYLITNVEPSPEAQEILRQARQSLEQEGQSGTY